MNWYKKASKEKTAPIPENFDTYEKSEEYPEWRLSVGANDWERAWTLMAFEFGDAQRVWVVINYPKSEFKGFVNDNGESVDKKLNEKATNWAEEAAKTWIKETKKNFKENGKEYYEWDFMDACIEVLDFDEMKPYVEEWGIDKHKWVGEDKGTVKKRIENYKKNAE